jgi:hypothetical protein
MLGKAERGSQPGRFDAEEVDEPGHSMYAFAVNAKIRRRLPWTHDLGTHAGISRPQCPAG